MGRCCIAEGAQPSALMTYRDGMWAVVDGAGWRDIQEGRDVRIIMSGLLFYGRNQHNTVKHLTKIVRKKNILTLKTKEKLLKK